MPTVFSIGSASAQGFGNQLPTGQYPVTVPFNVGLLNQQNTQYEVSTLDSAGNLIFVTTADLALSILKYDSTGVPQWQYKYYQTSVWQLVGCVTDSVNNIYALTADTSTGYTTFTVIKISSTGTFLAAYDMSTANATYITRPNCTSIKVDSSNNVYIVGYWSPNTGNLNASFVIKLNSSLALTWYYSYTFQPTATFYSDAARDVCVDSNGNVFVLGNTVNTSTSNGEFYVIKLTSSGSFSAGCKFSDAANYLSGDGSIFVDPSNNVYFTAPSNLNGPSFVKLNNSLTSITVQKYLSTFMNIFAGGYNPSNSLIYTLGNYNNGATSGILVSSVDTNFSNLNQCFFATTSGSSGGIFLNGSTGVLAFSSTNITFGCYYYNPGGGINPEAALNYFPPSYLTTSGTKSSTALGGVTFQVTGNAGISTVSTQSLTFTSGLTASSASVALTYTSVSYTRGTPTATLQTSPYT